MGKDKTSQPSARMVSLWVLMAAATIIPLSASTWPSHGRAPIRLAYFTGELETDVAGHNGGWKR